MIRARPQINGNTAEEFADAYMTLARAKDALDEAARKVLCDVMNRRNYQHLDQPDDAVIADRRRVQEAVRQAAGAIGAIQSDIADIVEASRQ
jgi:hypothetical protein